MLSRPLTVAVHVLKCGVLWGAGFAVLAGGIGALRAGHSGALEGLGWAAAALAVMAGLLVAAQIRPNQGSSPQMGSLGYRPQAPAEYRFSETLIALLACGVCRAVWWVLSQYWP